MAFTLKDVYCYQRGSEDCYKIGRTRVTPESRKRGFSTGSSLKFTLRRTEKTAHPTELESYIHALLSTRRAQNGEFFFVTRQEVDTAFDRAVTFMEQTREIVTNADKLKKRKPSDAMRDPVGEIVEIYRELKSKEREHFLLEREIEFLKSRIQLAIGETSGIEAIATWKWRDSWNIDLIQLRREEPDRYSALFDQYKRNSGGRRFELAKGILTKAEEPG